MARNRLLPSLIQVTDLGGNGKSVALNRYSIELFSLEVNRNVRAQKWALERYLTTSARTTGHGNGPSSRDRFRCKENGCAKENLTTAFHGAFSVFPIPQRTLFLYLVSLAKWESRSTIVTLAQLAFCALRVPVVRRLGLHISHLERSGANHSPQFERS